MGYCTFLVPTMSTGSSWSAYSSGSRLTLFSDWHIVILKMYSSYLKLESEWL